MYESSDLDFEAVAFYYGATELPTGSGWRKFRCFNQSTHEDRNASASYNSEERVMRCHACDLKGDAIQVIKILEGVDYAGAITFYERITKRDFPRVRQSTGGNRSSSVFNRGTQDYERGSGFVQNRFRR